MNDDDDDDWIEPEKATAVVFSGPMVRVSMREIWGDEIRVGDVIVPGCSWGEPVRHYSFQDIEERMAGDTWRAWLNVLVITHVEESCDCPSYLDGINWPYIWDEELEMSKDEHRKHKDDVPRRGWHRHLLARPVEGWEDIPKKGEHYPTIYENAAESMVRRTEDQWRMQNIYYLIGRFPMKEQSTIQQLGLF